MILRWTRSFFTDRKVQVRYSDGVSCQISLACGVPEECLICPILFLLYMTELMLFGNSRACLIYANDNGILAIWCTVAESAITAKRKKESLLKWAYTNAVKFDPRLTEVFQI